MQKLKFNLRQLLWGTFWFAVWLTCEMALVRLMRSGTGNRLELYQLVAFIFAVFAIPTVALGGARRTLALVELLPLLGVVVIVTALALLW